MLDDICRVCGNKILVAIFRGSGFCGVNCNKIHNGEEVVPNDRRGETGVLPSV